MLALQAADAASPISSTSFGPASSSGEETDFRAATEYAGGDNFSVPTENSCGEAGGPCLPNWLTPRLPPYRVRHIGKGRPLQGTSWLNRPHHADLFVGSWLGDSLIAGEVRQNSGFFSGVRVGCDWDHFWGSELRLSLSYVGVEYVPDGSVGEDSRNFLGDVHLLYYPWGDSRLRPFATLGTGLASFHFIDTEGNGINQTTVHFPVGLGLKYHWHRSLVWRMDLKDNISLGRFGLDSMHNWTLTGGVELHWGGSSSVSYFPW